MAGNTFFDLFGFSPRLGVSAVLEMALVNAKLIELARPYHEAEKELQSILGKYSSSELQITDVEGAMSDHEKIGDLQSKKELAENAWYPAFDTANKTFGTNVAGLITSIQNARPKTSASATA